MLCFDLLTRPKMPFRVTHRKEVTHSNGSYERKLRGPKLADEMGLGKEKSHYTLIDWRTGREWPLNCMTVISARWRSHRPFQRKRTWHIPIARHRKKLWRRVHITAWEFEGNIRPTNWTEDSWVRVPVGERCGRESHTRPKGLRLSSHGERERHNADGHNFGVKIFQLCSVSSSLSQANFEQPFRNLQIKWEVKYFIKKSSCVFLCASFITASVIHCVLIIVSLWYGRWVYNICKG